MKIKSLFLIMVAGLLIACEPNTSVRDALVKGTWLTDASSGCMVWGYSGRDPTGPMNWSGECVDGKASGRGVLTWAQNPRRSPFGSEVRYEGNLKAGFLDGPGVFVTTDTNSNVIHTTTIEGVWFNGEIEGNAQYVREGNYIDGRGTQSVVTTYEGEFKTREFWGEGRREKVIQYTNGRRELIIEEGQFEDNMLNGDGSRRHENISANGDQWIEHTVGIHKNRFFGGPGTLTFESSSATGTYERKSVFKSEISKGGTGIVVYADGDHFEGKTFADGSPMVGNCEFLTFSFEGPCLSKSIALNDFSGIVCIVAKQDEDTCLKQVGSWVF